MLIYHSHSGQTSIVKYVKDLDSETGHANVCEIVVAFENVF